MYVCTSCCPHNHIFLQRARAYTFRVLCIHAYTCRSREREDLWHLTFIHLYFCDRCLYTCDMMVHIYIHLFGCDASVSSFLCAIGLYHVCQMICIYTDIYNCILPTLMCMYVEGERTQSYLLDIWYVCRERMYTILFIIYVYTQIYLERDWVCDMTHSFICILVMHAFICVPWWFMYGSYG